MVKKIIAILLVAVTIFSIFSIDVFADEAAYTYNYVLTPNGTDEVKITATTTVNNASYRKELDLQRLLSRKEAD